MTQTNPIKLFVPAAALGLLLAATAAHAQSPFQPLQVDFAPTILTVTPGNSVTFSGTITNTTGSDVYINNYFIDTTSADLISDGAPFVNAFLSGPPVKLGSFQFYSYTDLFTVTAASNVAPGFYKGTFDIYGGADLNSDEVVGVQNFTVRVPPPAVPETSTMISFGFLLLGGLGVLAVKSRKRIPAA